ncbi:protein of unknown function [Burkholderia multivorans]
MADIVPPCGRPECQQGRIKTKKPRPEDRGFIIGETRTNCASVVRLLRAPREGLRHAALRRHGDRARLVVALVGRRHRIAPRRQLHEHVRPACVGFQHLGARGVRDAHMDIRDEFAARAREAQRERPRGFVAPERRRLVLPDAAGHEADGTLLAHGGQAVGLRVRAGRGADRKRRRDREPGNNALLLHGYLL